jgi:predicted Rossmann-fold nucleotide-binding protein
MRVCVYCGVGMRGRPLRSARRLQQLGSALAHRGIGLVYGGGHVGLMGLLAARRLPPMAR